MPPAWPCLICSKTSATSAESCLLVFPSCPPGLQLPLYCVALTGHIGLDWGICVVGGVLWLLVSLCLLSTEHHPHKWKELSLWPGLPLFSPPPWGPMAVQDCVCLQEGQNKDSFSVYIPQSCELDPISILSSAVSISLSSLLPSSHLEPCFLDTPCFSWVPMGEVSLILATCPQ